MIVDILTGFPEIFSGAVNSSILRAAMRSGALELWVHDLRHFSTDRHGKIDDVPYGGGAGMVMMAQPIWSCLDYLRTTRQCDPLLIFMSPQGDRLTQERVRRLSAVAWLIILCGHYKDVDARVFERDQWYEVSLGDFIVSGGELPAAILVDAVGRLLPGVLGDEASGATDSFEDGLLDAPYYTRPVEIGGLRVPDVLVSGNHAKIAEWRAQQKQENTNRKRPDLLAIPAEAGSSTNDKQDNHIRT